MRAFGTRARLLAWGFAVPSVFGLVGCAPEIDLFAVPAPVEAPDAGMHRSAEPGERPQTLVGDAAETVRVLPAPDVPAAEDPGACGASVLSATSAVIEKEVTVITEVESIKPLTFYLMFDQSLSMGLGGLWKPAVGALKSFLRSEQSQDVGVALQYFPSSGGVCSTGEGYSAPEVDVGLLPAHADALDASLDAHKPAGLGTPMEGALRGVTGFCRDFQAEHPDEQCVAVLVTDGRPELSLSCEESAAALAAIAAEAHADGVTTFAVGLEGANFELLDEIALQGGAPDCDPSQPTYACDVSSGAENLADTLALIRDKVVTTEVHTEVVTQVERVELNCEWSIPVQNEGAFDRDKVNILLSDAPETTRLVRVASAEACTDDGWYYDDPDSPTRIIACPYVCEAIEQAPDPTVDILLGCRTWLPE